MVLINGHFGQIDELILRGGRRSRILKLIQQLRDYGVETTGAPRVISCITMQVDYSYGRCLKMKRALSGGLGTSRIQQIVYNIIYNTLNHR